MKKLLLATLLLTASCQHEPKNISTQVIEFAEMSGKIKIKITGKNLESIESTGSAALHADNEHEIEQAMIKATLRAKANLVEFIKSDIKASKMSSTTSSLEKDSVDNAKLKSEVSEVIKSESQMILNGVYVIERKISDDRKYVYVKVRSEKAVKDIISNWR